VTPNGVPFLELIQPLAVNRHGQWSVYGPPRPIPTSTRGSFANRRIVRIRMMRCRSQACSSSIPVSMSLLQRGAIASRASNVLPGAGAQFHRNETTRQAIYAETRLFLSIMPIFGDRARSGAPAMRTAKRDSPSARCVHQYVIAVHLTDFVRPATRHNPSVSPPSLFKIAHSVTSARADLTRATRQPESCYELCATIPHERGGMPIGGRTLR
jgi:hypothetical protein